VTGPREEKSSAPGEAGGHTTVAQASALLVETARLLFEHGETTHRTVSTVTRLGTALGFPVSMIPRWGELTLRIDTSHGPYYEIFVAEPLGVDMGKVVATNELVDRVCGGKLDAEAAGAALAAIVRKPPVSLLRFAVLAGAGAAALGVIFGAADLVTLALIAASAGLGACLRRWLAAIGGNPFMQPLCAALLAGGIGAASARLALGSALNLVAVCPCMVLVPGPHLLNGTIDLARARISLGAARVGYAGLITLMICTGLIIGLALGGVSLAVSGPAAKVPLAYDVIAAGVAVAAYGTFFAMPWRMLPIPIVIGMLAHASRWAMVAVVGAGVEIGALVACLIVGVIVTPLGDRLRLPFAALAFASVVSLIPGAYLFQMAGGLVGLVNLGANAPSSLLYSTVVDGTTAILITLAITFGLILPKMCIEYFFPRLTDPNPRSPR
jgi:uncharacterized membrane protein YjjP (DUF1212 family)